MQSSRTLNETQMQQHRRWNVLHTLALLGGVGLLFGLTEYLLVQTQPFTLIWLDERSTPAAAE